MANVFDQFDAGSAPPSGGEAGGNPFDQFDTAPAPPPKTEEKPPGLLGTAGQALFKGLKQGVTETAQAPTAFRDREPEAPDTSYVGKLLSQPITEGWTDPKWWTAHIVHGAAASSPSLALGAAGALAGAAVPGADVSGIPQLVGGAGGFALGSAIQTIAPAYQAARARGLDHEAAVHDALTTAGIATALGAVMGLAPAGVNRMLEGTLSRTLAEMFAVQPGLGAAQQVATAAATGQPMPSGEQLGTSYAEQVGMGLGLTGAHAAYNRLRGQRAPTETAGPEGAAGAAAPSIPETAPSGAPAPSLGSTIGMDLGNGVEPVTVERQQGDLVYLKDAEGRERPMTAGDVAKFQRPLPEPEAPPENVAPAEKERPAAAAQTPTQEAVPEPTAPPPFNDALPESFQAPPREEAPAPPPPESPATDPETAEAREAVQAVAEMGDAAAGIVEDRIAEEATPETPEATTPRGVPETPAEEPAAAPAKAYDPQALKAERAKLPEGWTLKYSKGLYFLTDPSGKIAQWGQRKVLEGMGDFAKEQVAAEAAAAEARMPEGTAEVAAMGEAVASGENPVPELPEPEPEPTTAPENQLLQEPPAAVAPESGIVENTAPPIPTNADNGPVVSNEKHTKTGKDLFAVRFPEKPDIDGLGAKAKTLGGYWSSYRGNGMQPGWMFKTREGADQFATWAREKLGEAPSIGAEAPSSVPEERPGVIMADPETGETRVVEPEARGTPESRLQYDRLPREQKMLYGGMYDALFNGYGILVGDPMVERARPFYDQGLVKGPEDVFALANNDFDPAKAGLYGKGAIEGEAAPVQPLQELPAPANRPPKGLTEIGRNYIGQTLYEDERGVRSIIENGIRKTESVGITPGGGLVLPPRRGNEAYQIAEPEGERPVEYKPPETPELASQGTVEQQIDNFVKGEGPPPAYPTSIEPPRGDPIRDAAREVFEIYQATRNVEEAQSRLAYEAGQAGFKPEQVAQVIDEFDRMRERELDRLAAQVPGDIDTEEARLRVEVAQAREDTETGPSQDQKEAGVYRKGRVDFHGLKFVLENPEGEIREGAADEDGNPLWKSQMPADYGYIQRTEGADGDQVDAYLGNSLLSQKAWIIDQVDPDTGRFDEHKLLLGFSNWFDAKLAYLNAFTDGRSEERLGQVTPMSLDEVKEWLKTGDMKSPVGQKSLSFNKPAPTLPVEADDAVSNELRGAVPPRDEGQSASDVYGAAQARPARPASRPEGPGGLRAPEIDLEGQREPEPAGAPGGGGGREIDLDRVPEGVPEGAAGEPGAAGGPELPGERPGAPTGRVPDSDRFAGLDFQVKGQNHVIEPGAVEEARSPRTKAKDNLAAIELAKDLAISGRAATKAEQDILAKYVGWGGLSGAFPDPETGAFKKGFEDIGQRLRSLLDADEYNTANRSTQYAHYTSETVIRAMWDAARRLGFKGGSVFEPGMGVGHFLGMMPQDLAKVSQYQGVEMDHITAQIAKQLYPQSGVREADLRKVPLPQDTFDLAIGNPPFAATVIRSDPKYAAQRFMLHDYMFAKSIDAVRPGGLLAFVTSAGTMNKMEDSARRYLAERADLVGAIRLPDTAFAKNAGTEVSTDILFFKKHPARVELGDTPPDWTQTAIQALPGRKGNPVEGHINQYFTAHPEMVLGDQTFAGNLRARETYATKAREGADLETDLRNAIQRLPENVMQPPLSQEQKAALDFNAQIRKEGSFYLGDDGRLMQYSEGAGRPVAARGAGVKNGKTQAELQTIRQLIPLRDAMLELYKHDLAGNTQEAAQARAELNRVYDQFVAKNGPINKAEFSYRRPTIVQQESARAEAREEARDMGLEWDEGEFDPAELISAKAKTTEIAQARQKARETAAKLGREFNEGNFDPADMPDIEVIKRVNLDAFRDDQDSYRLAALEDYNPRTGVAEKRRVFTESTLTREQEPQLNSANDGILWSINKFGRLDLDAIAQQLGRDRNTIIQEMGDSVMLVPGSDSVYEPRDAYLSGDVVTKLDEAREAARKDPRFQANVRALEDVQPQPMSPAEISLRLGMPWMPPDMMRAFAREHLEIGDVPVKYSPILGRWIVEEGSKYRPIEGAKTAEWSVENELSAPRVFDLALNGKSARITKTDKGPPQRTYVDVKATEAAQDRVDRMKAEFKNWVGQDVERGDELARLYNDKYNRVVLRQWNGDYLTTPGVSSDWRWRPHQTRGVARVIQAGNTYLAHAVGAGKTSLMIGSAMEQRRLGLINKPLFIVPNHMLAQFAKEFYEQYPTARVRVADERNFHTDRRKQFVADVAAQDLDGIILTHSAFKKIPISREFGDQIVQEHLDEIDEAMREQGVNPNDPKDIKKNARGNVTVKQLAQMKENLEEKLRSAGGNQDEVINFEEMGVDFMFVDEAHEFRKLNFVTQTPMKGIAPQGSDKAWDLYTKVRYLDQNRPGRSLVMASGTPVTNTMGELYTLQRYMQPQTLKDNGLSHFDSWAQSFGDTETKTEQTAAGTYEAVTRFAKFVNAPELYKMVGQIMDNVTSQELEQYVTRPEVAGGGRKFDGSSPYFHLAARTDWMRDFQGELANRITAIRNRGRPAEKGEDIMLSVINDGRNAALDPRLVDPNVPREAWQNSKLNEMIGNVHQVWEATKNQAFYDPTTGYQKEIARGPATQLVFANFGIASGNGKFSAYQWMRREWRRMGIPDNEVAFIKDYNTPTEKQRLFNDVNDGKVRILVGSVAKMGTGMNVQRRLAAIHNLDPLWYPADDEQRNGRGIRQGNWNPEIQIHDYSTEGTYDSVMWAMMGRKGRFIEQFFRGDPNLREIEDLGEASQYEQAAAMSTADERVIRLTEMKQELEKLERRQSGHASEQYSYRRNVDQYQRQAAYHTAVSDGLSDAIARRQDIAGDKFKMQIGAKAYADRAQAGEALEKAINETAAGMRPEQETVVATIGGFPLRIYLKEYRENKTGADGVRRSTVERVPHMYLDLFEGPNGSEGLRYNSGRGLIASAESELRSLESSRAVRLQEAEVARGRLESNRAAIGKPFADADKIEPLRQQVYQLEGEISAPKPAAQLPAQEATPRGVEPGRLEDEGRASGIAGQYRDLRNEFADFSKASDLRDPHDLARAWVVERGGNGTEFAAIHDPATGEIVHAGTSGQKNFVFVPNVDLTGLVIHHNHPSGKGLSTSDIGQLGYGLGVVVAHTADGNVSAARITPDFAALIDAMGDEGRKYLISAARSEAIDAVDRVIRPAVRDGSITVEDGNKAYFELVNRALARAGLIDYISSRDPWAAIPKELADRALDRATDAVEKLGYPGVSRAADDRSTLALRPEEAMGSIRDAAQELAAGRSGGAGGAERGRENDVAPGRFGDESTSDLERERRPVEATPDALEDLIKTPSRNPTDEPARAAIEEAISGTGSETTRFQKLRRTLGTATNSPGSGDHWYNIVNKMFTTPLGKAALDPRSAKKMQAVMARTWDAAELSKGYFDRLKSWEGATNEDRRAVYGAAEILNLQGDDVPLDGRAVIAENLDHKYAAYSKPGEIVRLESPRQIQMFTELRQTLDQVWKDLVAEVARAQGWSGRPTAGAIYAAAGEAKSKAEQRSLERTARLVAALEAQRRGAYLPLMRSGDYFLRVTPKRPNADWNGEGTAPTTMFKLIDSLTAAERVTGGIREGVPQKVTKELSELRGTFPEEDYDIEHGYSFRSADPLKDMDLPAIDKLMMLVGNDARADLQKGLEAAGVKKDDAKAQAKAQYSQLRDAIIDQLMEERVAGFRRQREGIPGYDPDFASSTSKYINWLSNYVSDIRHRPEMEAADQAIHGDGGANSGHPDPRTRQYWRDYDRMTEDFGFGDQLHGPLARLRQGAFFWLLGANASTTAKILLHGPMRGVPILGTGLGGAGRMRAAADYLGASAAMLKGLSVGKNGIELDPMVATKDNVERALLQDSEAKGILHPQTAEEMASHEVRREGEAALSDKARFRRRVFDIWTSNVSASDRMIRSSMLLSAYRTAQREGMPAINKVWDKDQFWAATQNKTPEAFAQFMVTKTVGQWGSVNRMPILRTVYGGMVGQFKSYELGYVSNVYNMLTRMGPEGKVTAALMLGGLGMMGGALAIPFAKDAENAAEAAWGMVSGLAPNLAEDLKSAMEGLFPGAGDALMHGPARALTGIDWSGVGFGDLLSRNTQSPLDSLGAAMSTFVGAPHRAYQREESGQEPLSVLRELMPNAAKNMIGGLYPETALASAKTGTLVTSPENLSTADQVKMGLGFPPAVVAERREEQGKVIQLQDHYRHALAGAANRIANLAARGEDYSDAVVQGRQLVAEARQKAGFGPGEMDAFNRQVRAKIRQRMHPEVPGKAEQRIEAARQP